MSISATFTCSLQTTSHDSQDRDDKRGRKDGIFIQHGQFGGNILCSKSAGFIIQAEKFGNSFRGHLVMYDQSNCVALW